MSKKKFFVTVLTIGTILAFWALPGLAATLNVPVPYATITAALAAADTGDTINVAATYTGAGETYPILVQKNDITIVGNGATLEVGDIESRAVFVVGAYREYNPASNEYEDVTISGVTIRGFAIDSADPGSDMTADVGFVVKDATDVTIADNTIDATETGDTMLEGIRLIDATGCHIVGNQVLAVDEIGIFLQYSDANALAANLVLGCGLGLFILESDDNTVTDDIYVLNLNGGVVVNDSVLNVLSGLTVEENTGWGVRFVYANENELLNSDIRDNTWGGVELLASQLNVVEGNVVYNNGTASDGSDDAQIVVTFGDKALFTTGVFAAYNVLGDLAEFVEEKHEIEGWLVDFEAIMVELDLELEEVIQKLATALGLLHQGDVAEANALMIDEIYVEWALILGKLGSLITTYDDIRAGVLALKVKVSFFATKDLITADDETQLRLKLDAVLGYLDQIDVVLTMLGYKFSPGVPELFWDNLTAPPDTDDGALVDQATDPKAEWSDTQAYTGDYSALLEVPTNAQPGNTPDGIARVKISTFPLPAGPLQFNQIDGGDASKMNFWAYVDSGGAGLGADLYMCLHFVTPGGTAYRLAQAGTVELLTGSAPEANIGAWKQYRGTYIAGTELAWSPDQALHGEPAWVPQTYNYFMTHGFGADTLVATSITLNNRYTAAKLYIDDIMINGQTYANWLLESKLLLEDAIVEKEEMTGIIVHIWEKLCLVDLELPPFPEVNTSLVGKKEKPFAAITAGDITAMKTAIVDALNADPTAVYIRSAVACTWPGVTSWVVGDITANHVGLLSSEGNTIASNLITSDLISTDRNIGIVIECKDNTIVNNLITNERVEPIDAEAEYGEFHRLDKAMWLLADECLIAYNAIEWVNDGINRGGDWERHDYQNEYVFTKMAEVAYWPPPGYTVSDWCGAYDETDFDARAVVWVPVLTVDSRDLAVGFTASVTVKRNRLSLNFFDHAGTGIDIIDAESNIIDENLFYKVATAAIIFGDGVGPGIVLEENDYYGGIAVANYMAAPELPVNASHDYTPPVGQEGHATVVGSVSPPAAPAPFAYDNFNTDVKYEILGILVYFPGVDAEATLPPNLDFFFPGVVLPVEKPRLPGDIFGELPPPTEQACYTYAHLGWYAVSVPYDPILDPDPAVVFDEVPGAVAYDAWPFAAPYAPATAVDPTHGYWLYLDSAPTTICVDGTPPGEFVDVDLVADSWYLISVPFQVRWLNYHVDHGEGVEVMAGGTTLADVLFDVGYLYPWFADSQSYAFAYAPGADPDHAYVMFAWFGFWVKTNGTCTLRFHKSPIPTPLPSLGVAQPMGVPVTTGMPRPPTPPTLGIGGAELAIAVRQATGAFAFSVVGFRSPMVTEVTLKVYGLGGELVYEASTPGAQITWAMTTADGAPAANGVYLYQLDVELSNGEIIPMGMGRVLLLR